MALNGRKIIVAAAILTLLIGTFGLDSSREIGAAVNDSKLELKEDPDSESGTGAAFEFSGMVRLTSVQSTFPDQERGDSIIKEELRNKVKLKYGYDDIYFFIVGNAYVNSRAINDEYGSFGYSETGKVSHNGTLSSRYGEVSFKECYINIRKGPVRLRAGNQNIAWGTADVNNPTSYFNPNDFREFLLKEEDELALGVPTVSAMWYFGDIVLETVFAPVHVAAAMPSGSDFWVPAVEGYPFDVKIMESKPLDVEPRNFGYGGRFSGSVFGVDLSVSAYHGPDKEPLLVPDHINLNPGKPVELEVVPIYYIINKYGFDFSMNLDKFVVQFEAAYSPDKHGLPNLAENKAYDLPIKDEKSRYIAYSTGFNYFIPLNRVISGHEGDTVLTMEWFQAKFLDDALEQPFLTDIISGRLEDGYFSGRLKISLTGMYDTRGGGYVAWPKIQLDFLNGLIIEMSYVYIDGKDDSLIGYYRDKDLVMARVRYEY